MNNESNLFNPKPGTDYWLGYHQTGLFSSSKSIYGVYFGIIETFSKYEQRNIRAHLFLDINNKGKLEIFLANVEHNPNKKGNCPLTYWSDGDDEPAISAVAASQSEDLILSELETSYAIKRIKQIRKEHEQVFELNLKNSIDKYCA